MVTLMTKLTVKCPRGQRDEVFRDSGWDQPIAWNEYRELRVYSYRVMSGNVLKIYSHKGVSVRGDFDWDPDDADDEGMEVAHFRPNQWDKVRSG
jgi:hypothetical protein